MTHRATLLLLIATLQPCTRSFAQADTSFKRITHVMDSYPMMSPDRQKIVFESTRTGSFEIYTMNADGSALKQLTFNNAFDGTPCWSPDGKMITFASERDNDSEIYLMDADGSHQRRLTNAPGDDSHPKFSPDGKRIIFCSARSSPDLSVDWGKQYLEIYTMATDGSDLQELTDFKTISTFPSFSPDGQKIVFRMVIPGPSYNWDLTNTLRNSEVFVMNSHGKDTVNISHNASFDGWPVWSPDGRYVYFASNRNGPANCSRIFRANADGSNLKQISNKDGCFTQPSVSSDGKLLFVYDFTETPTLEYGGIGQFAL